MPDPKKKRKVTKNYVKDAKSKKVVKTDMSLLIFLMVIKIFGRNLLSLRLIKKEKKLSVRKRLFMMMAIK